MKPIRAVLFDLDGTLLDTAVDLANALNQLRKMHGLPDVILSSLIPLISDGSKKMLKQMLNVEETDQNFHRLRDMFFTVYSKHCSDHTQFFPGMENVLTHLTQQNIRWGIVTNRLTIHTDLLLTALNIKHLPVCVVCGDTLAKAKPDPAPILHACEQMKIDPEHCIYVGDAETDIMAGKSAGLRSLVALYGYLTQDVDPYQWNADGYLYEPIELIDWIKKVNG